MFKMHRRLLTLVKAWLILNMSIYASWGYRNNYQHYKPDVQVNSKIWKSGHQNLTLSGRSKHTQRRPPPSQTRILGGRLARYGEANYQVLLLNHKDGSICGGTLVEINGLRFVVSAAHCVWVGENSAAQLVTPEYVNIRAATINWHEFNPNQVDFNVTRLEAHEDFDPRHRHSDIAVLFLDKYVGKFEGMTTMPMARPDFDLPDWFTLSGFGRTATEAENDGRLRVVDVPLFPSEECIKIAPFVTDLQFCIANTDYQVPKGDCFGDSGGPIIGYNWSEYRWYHYGTVSAGVVWQCGKPSFHTRVSKYFDWIYGKVQDQLFNCGNGHPVEDPPSRYPNCKYPYSDPCYQFNACKVDASIFPDENKN